MTISPLATLCRFQNDKTDHAYMLVATQSALYIHSWFVSITLHEGRGPPVYPLFWAGNLTTMAPNSWYCIFCRASCRVPSQHRHSIATLWGPSFDFLSQRSVSIYRCVLIRSIRWLYSLASCYKQQVNQISQALLSCIRHLCNISPCLRSANKWTVDPVQEQ